MVKINLFPFPNKQIKNIISLIDPKIPNTLSSPCPSLQNHRASAMSTATTAALQGAATGSSHSNNHHNTSMTNNADLGLDDFHFSSSQLLSFLDSKDEAFQVLKSDLMDALNKEVKSLDEDSWMFEGPRSRINLISNPGRSFVTRNA